MFYVFRKFIFKEICSSLYFTSRGFHSISKSLCVTDGCSRYAAKPPMIKINQQSLRYCNFSVVCWQCKAPRENELFCSICSFIQRPIQPIDYFKLLSVDKTFEIKEEKLIKNFKKLQMLLHPDKFSLKSKEERAIAEEFSSLVNKAYSTLRHPLSRGVYLLESFGVRIEEESSIDDPLFLMEIMELNEAVESAKVLEDIRSVDLEVKRLSLETTVAINKAFKSKRLNEAKKLLIKLRYYSNIASKTSERLLEFGFI